MLHSGKLYARQTALSCHITAKSITCFLALPSRTACGLLVESLKKQVGERCPAEEAPALAQLPGQSDVNRCG